MCISRLRCAVSLARLETFDLAAFLGDAATSQALCDFVVALGLVYNDLRDIVSAHILLNEIQPAGQPAETREWAAFLGLRLHALVFSLV